MKIYIVKNEDGISNEYFDYMMNTLPAERQNEILSQRIKTNAENMLIGSILAKFAIKKEFGISISRQIFDTGKHRKPYLINYPDIHFNISHSGQYVVCAVANVPIGVDVQKVSEFNLGVAERVCNEQEIAQISASADKASEFIKLWTQKEAYVKMLGCGIGQIDLKNVPITNVRTIRIGDYYISVC